MPNRDFLRVMLKNNRLRAKGLDNIPGHLDARRQIVDAMNAATSGSFLF